MEVIQNNNTAPQGENLSLWGYFVRCITKKYSDFSGRARRKEWWSYILFQLLIFIVPVVLFVATSVGEMISDPDTMQYMSQNPDDEEYIYFMSGNVYFWAMMIVGLLLFVPWLAVTCRRFHDVGLSTGLFWVVGGLTILNDVIALLVMIEPGVVPHAVTSISKILSYLTGLVVLVVAFIPGKTGPNAYGPDPKPAPTCEDSGQE